jgi:hypothetical protein
VSGSRIVASGGNLTLGANVFGGFVHNGELSTGTNAVTITSQNRATLGSLTTLGGGTAGTLNIANGAVVDFGRAITGFGTLVSPNLVARSVIVNGNAAGTSATNRLTFDGYVKGVGEFENVTFNGTFSPGLSPTISDTTNAAFGAASTLEMEIGGTTPGSQHDKIIDAGTLALGGTLKVLFLGGYVPDPAHTFDILDWNALTGTFAGFDFSAASAPAGYDWDTSALYTTGTLSFTPVPESPFVLGLAAVALFAGVTMVRLGVRREPVPAVSVSPTMSVPTAS